MHQTIEKLLPTGLIAIVCFIFFYILLGLSGAFTLLTIMLFFMLPLYLILDNFNLEQDEKIIFSFFASVGVVPSIAYWVGQFISFKLGIFISFALLLLTSFLIKKYTTPTWQQSEKKE